VIHDLDALRGKIEHKKPALEGDDKRYFSSHALPNSPALAVTGAIVGAAYQRLKWLEKRLDEQVLAGEMQSHAHGQAIHRLAC